MTWDPTPPEQPPVDGGRFDPPADPHAPTLAPPPAPAPSTGPPPPANPAWPGAAQPTNVSVPPVPPRPTPLPAPYGTHGTYASPPPMPPAPPAAPGWAPGAPTPPPNYSAPVAVRPRHTGLKVMGATVFALALVGSGFGVRALTEDQTASTIIRNPTPVATVPSVAIDPNAEPLAAVAASLSPSVVQIEVTNGLGSGVAYDGQGHILTNAHVVGEDRTVTVRTADGRAVEGRVLGTDTGTDIAVVQISGVSIPAVPLAESPPIVGQTAVALGSPFGLDQTVTAGIVSAVNRPVDNDKGVVVNMIQTDASINPGNSGGALVNKNGQLIGINTAIFSQSGENNGIGFAIPVKTARAVADKIVNGQSTAKAGLGLTGPPETPSGDAGAYVESLTAGGAAEAGGIEAGDVIVSVDGTAVRSFEQLRGVISAYGPGQTVTVEVVRDGTRQSVQVTLGTLNLASPPTTTR